ncbi:MAG TPA: hypothetical protein P5555_20590, partial [Candidatus Paceibacterota bacterium]|nr:hypothetical protein [Verrucomicrobiota bacterium]HRZ47581.1 hypothetical protein [Candidatus Paceibacterota bacterium]
GPAALPPKSEVIFAQTLKVVNDPEPLQESTVPPYRKGVLCAQCDHLNPPGSRDCEYCHVHLWVACPHCAQETQPVFSKCIHCNSRIERHWRRPLWWKRMFYGGRKLTISQILVIGIIALIAYLIIFELPKHL